MLFKFSPEDLGVKPGRVDCADLFLWGSVQGHVVLLRVEMNFVVWSLHSKPVNTPSLLCPPSPPYLGLHQKFGFLVCGRVVSGTRVCVIVQFESVTDITGPQSQGLTPSSYTIQLRGS